MSKIARVKFIRDKEPNIKALTASSKVLDGAIYVATDTGTMWLGTSATALLQIKDNIDTNTTYTLTKSGSTIQLKNQAGTVVSSITDTNTTYGNATSSAAGLMSAADKAKLDGVASGANNITVDSALSNISTNPVQNKVINTALAGKAASSHSHSETVTAGDTRTVATKPSDYPNKIKFVGLKTNVNIGNPSGDTFSYVVGMRGWSDISGGSAYEFAANNTNISYRKEKDASTWNSWHKFYTDENKPTWSDVQSKPSFATVATSGSYNDLSNKPTIPTVPSAIKNPNALTISLNGNSQGAYDGSAAKSINVTAANIGAAAASHNHSAANITSGTFDIARIPNVNDKVTSVAVSKLSGVIDASHLPSYVDDVIEGYYNSSKFYKTKNSNGTYATEITGEAGKIYVNLNDNKTYRWSGTAYVVISETLALGETSSTAYRGDRGAAAYSHISRTDNPHGVTKSQVGLGNVENKSSATIRGELTKANVTTALGYTPPTADTNTWRPVVNNLASTATDQSLSAAQGKVLNDKFGSYVPTSRTVNGKALTGNISLSYGDVGAAASSHSHNYLPLSGGTMTGTITGKSNQGSWISARDNACLTNAAGTDGSYNPALSQKTANGEWSIGNLSGQETLTFAYTTNTDYSTGTNTNKTIQFPVASGIVALTSQIPSVGNGTVTITQNGKTMGTFTLNQAGNATIALTDNNTVYSLPTATSSVLGGVKVGSNITNSSGTISLTKANVTAALGYTPPTSDTNTWRPEEVIISSTQPSASTCKLWIKI